MKILKRFIPLIIPLLLITVFFTGCTATTHTTKAETTSNTATDIAVVLTAIVSPTATIAVDPEFTERDLATTYDDSTAAVHVILDGSNIQVTGDGATASNRVLTITKEGVYVVTGNLTDRLEWVVPVRVVRNHNK